MKTLAPYSKAIAAGVASALAFLIPVAGDGLTVPEILGALLAGLAGAGVGYAAPKNAEK